MKPAYSIENHTGYSKFLFDGKNCLLHLLFPRKLRFFLLPLLLKSRIIGKQLQLFKSLFPGRRLLIRHMVFSVLETSATTRFAVMGSRPRSTHSTEA